MVALGSPEFSFACIFLYLFKGRVLFSHIGKIGKFRNHKIQSIRTCAENICDKPLSFYCHEDICKRYKLEYLQDRRKLNGLLFLHINIHGSFAYNSFVAIFNDCMSKSIWTEGGEMYILPSNISINSLYSLPGFANCHD